MILMTPIVLTGMFFIIIFLSAFVLAVFEWNIFVGILLGLFIVLGTVGYFLSDSE